ncbi:hypothetical protein [Algoriphagus antarcticus]|uniref:Natural product n=1 Tax=Algoriphagus antarcticus TaxID=238540 RepID=A0A3E0DNX1_9BACT|nr:hypothetical protein [Algoriphagus antarcticus]REG84536.1 hypothetical protein C8N25_115116 [Algoriphagus antarcticus]
MKKLRLSKLKLTSEEVLDRNELTNIYGGSGSGPSSYCVSLYVIRSCNSNYGSQAGWNSGWASGSCSVSPGGGGYNGATYYDSAQNSGYNISSCTNFGWMSY